MRKLFILGILALVVIAIAGCYATTSSLQKSTPEKIANDFKVDYDKYTKVGSVIGPTMECRPKSGMSKFGSGNFRLVDYTDTVNMVYFHHKSGNGTFALMISISETNWCFADSMYDIDSQRFEDKSPHRSVISGDHVLEQLTFNLSREYLESHKETGIEAQVNCRGIELYIPPNYIKAMLLKADSI